MKKLLGRRMGWVAGLALYLMVFGMTSAQAYIDPSATTYLIQAIAGVAVALGSFGVIMWRRAKKRLKSKLNIDMDKNLEKEEDVVVKQDASGEQ